MRVKRGSYTEQLLPLMMIKIIKVTSIIFLILVIFALYNSIYFDIPRSDVVSKHAKGNSEFIELDDGSLIHIRDEGNKDGKILVMVHGFNGSLFNFETMVPFLKDQFRILSLDLPAHGLTGSVKSNLYSYDGFYSVINVVLEKQDIKKFYLVGHSMGGMVAWRYSLDRSEQIKGLIIIGSPFIGSEKEYREFQSVNAPPVAFELLESRIFREMLAYITPRFLVKEGVSQTVYDQTLVTEELVDQFHEIILQEGSREAMGELLINFEDNFISDVALLKNIEMPTLILHGEQDKLVDLRFVNHFVDKIPNVKLVTYPKVGHMPPMEIPEQLAYDIENFVKKN